MGSNHSVLSYVLSRKLPTMRLTKKLSLAALLPLLALLLATVFAPAPPVAETPVAVVQVEQPAPRPDLLSSAWDHARHLWLAAWGVSRAA